MKNLSPFRFPGGKTSLLPQIIPYIEKSIEETKLGLFSDVFIGGGSVLLEMAKNHPKLELFANDKDEHTYSFWKLVSSSNQSDLNDLKGLLAQKPTIDLFYKLRETESKSLVESAYRAVFYNRTSFSGDMRRTSSPIGGKDQKSKWTVDCRYNPDKLIEKINIISKLLSGRTTVFNQDINDCSLLNPSYGTIYLDPPYYKMGKQLYHEYMKHDEHIMLAERLSKRQHWILSYDNHESILDMYSNQDIRFVDTKYCIRGSKTNWHQTKEVLILPKS